MTKKALRNTRQQADKKIMRKMKKDELPASSVRKLAGGWGRKEADELLKSLEAFNQMSKLPENKVTY